MALADQKERKRRRELWGGISGSRLQEFNTGGGRYEFQGCWGSGVYLPRVCIFLNDVAKKKKSGFQKVLSQHFSRQHQ